MQLVKDAIIMPFEGTIDAFSGGVFNSQGKFFEDCLTYRGREPQLRAAEDIFEGTYIYGGCLFAHFGHFIWESLARLATIRKCRTYPILFISPNQRLFDTYKFIFHAIGIKNDIHVIDKPAVVKQLIYSPPQSSIRPLIITDEQIKNLACINAKYKNQYRKIWLSRSKLKYCRVTNEESIEGMLKLMGFNIIYPERMTLIEQVKIINSANIVAGFDGSQFFSSLFSNNVSAQFYIFNRRPNIPDTISYALKKKNISHTMMTYKVKLDQCDENFNGKNYQALEVDKIVNDLKNI